MGVANSAPAWIIGLGNPGSGYAATRHNAGFWLVDAVARRSGAAFKDERRLSGAVCRVEAPDSRWSLFKPATYMNRSGQAVAALCRFYRLAPEDLLVVHDDLDLPPGVARFKHGGGHGGHNGLKDLVRHLPGPDFHRLRIGVGHPGPGGDVVAYVLGRPPTEERDLIMEAIDAAIEVLPFLATGAWERATTALHSRPAPGG